MVEDATGRVGLPDSDGLIIESRAHSGRKAWFACRLGPSTFSIFDVFPEEAGLRAHLSDEVRARMEKVNGLLVQPRTMEKLHVLATKLPDFSLLSQPLQKLRRSSLLCGYKSAILTLSLPGQGGFEVDRCGRERFGYRAIFFGILRQLLEGLFVYAWHNGLDLQVDRVDGEAAGHLIEVYTRGCVHARWREASTCERVR
jgi:hypothetical protein